MIAAFTACTQTQKTATKKTSSGKPAKQFPPGVQEGLATWYGGNHHNGPTASGEKFNKHAMTAAHRTLPMNTRVKVTNKKNGRSVELRINDRGPYGNRRRIIDVSEGAAKLLDMIEAGVVPVRVEVMR
ncbi:MAG: septal ring lytic transglycosylase RlpA family protein [Deltaproteobacteria bacterium]|nr:septal ring lytic transglycosylase RlpA family protein [Deltaproteobacteria bacterium]